MKIVWIIAVAVVLIWALWTLNVGELSETFEYEVGVASLIFMGILSFPLGPVILFLFDQIIDVIQPSLLDDRVQAEVVLIWTSCAFGGYVQWFIVIPKIIRKIKRNAKSTHKHRRYD